MRFTKRVVAKGLVTVPTDLREAMGIDAGDLVEFQVVGIRRRSDPRTLIAAPSAAKPTSPEA